MFLKMHVVSLIYLYAHLSARRIIVLRLGRCCVVVAVVVAGELLGLLLLLLLFLLLFFSHPLVLQLEFELTPQALLDLLRVLAVAGLSLSATAATRRRRRIVVLLLACRLGLVVVFAVHLLIVVVVRLRLERAGSRFALFPFVCVVALLACAGASAATSAASVAVTVAAIVAVRAAARASATPTAGHLVALRLCSNCSTLFALVDTFSSDHRD